MKMDGFKSNLSQFLCGFLEFSMATTIRIKDQYSDDHVRVEGSGTTWPNHLLIKKETRGFPSREQETGIE